MPKFEMEGYIDYPGKGKIYDKDVWELIKKHSRLVDRMSSTKMVEMSLLGQCILMGVIDKDPDDLTWRFYGKRANW